ncbi:MAG: copper chaperone PCu(A)C [Acidimicrobiales bacterium]|jgi:copper(I)-binding protein|nr:copper chaperone PCu(A)C [Acidimicrobiales bacterium]
MTSEPLTEPVAVPDDAAGDVARPSLLRRWAPVLVVLGGIAVVVVTAIVSPFDSQPPKLTVQAAYLGAGADPAGAYLVIVNDGGGDDLVGVSVPGATVTLQRRVADPATGTAELEEATSLRLAGYETTRLQPGGDQLLLTGLTPVEGPTVPMELRFRVADPVTVQAEVLSYDQIGQLLLPPRLETPAGP